MRCEVQGDDLNWSAVMKLMKAIKGFTAFESHQNSRVKNTSSNFCSAVLVLRVLELRTCRRGSVTQQPPIVEHGARDRLQLLQRCKSLIITAPQDGHGTRHLRVQRMVAGYRQADALPFGYGSRSEIGDRIARQTRLFH
jgi:hypothetical protein